jgi:YfiH family protein
LSHVQCNRSVLQEALGVKLVFLQQVHGTELLELTQSTPNDQSADAAFTRSAGLACTITVADCLPVLLCDLAGTMVAAVHAGWRGLAGLEGVGVLEQIHKQFVALTPVRPAQEATEVIAWLGPCIGASAFEVGSEVRLALVQGRPEAEHCFMPLSKGKWLADLPALARLRLKALGIERVFGNDGSAPWCTVSNPSRFFSYRRDHVCGRQAACIWLG